MRMYDIITRKRYCNELTKEEIQFFISGVTNGTIPDYQIAALLMAICINGMTSREASDLTQAMANSGAVADLSNIKGVIVDKHSSGGVGDKCTLIVGPIVSAYGVPFAKLSGRGLGHTGGTIDKLDAIKGFRTNFTLEEFIDKVNETGILIAGQTGEIAPADKKLYALRDVTATVESIPLIAASIMSKKLASGANNILLDVKCGNGAFMQNIESATKLANLMVDIGKLSGKNMKAFVTNMDQPLGKYIGNALEVTEAYDSLCGNGPSDLMEICIALSAGMLELAGLGDYDECRKKAWDSIHNGMALKQFQRMVISQGGSLDVDGKPVLLGETKYTYDVISNQTGIVKSIMAKDIGIASLILGAGRETKEDIIDPAAGIILHKKIGDNVDSNDIIATLYTNRFEMIKDAENKVLNAYEYVDTIPSTQKYIYEIIS